MGRPTHLIFTTAIANVVPLLAALRNIFLTGVPLSFIPSDDIFQAHFHGNPPSNEKMKYVFRLFGVCLLFAVLGKVVTVFGHHEGTYLRQKLLFTFGCLDLAFAYLVLDYSGFPPYVVVGFAGMLAFEGVVFVADAVLRRREPKPKRKAA